MALVVDASVALKWVLPEPDSPLAQALVASGEELLLPDFWLNEATNICWLQVHKGKWSADEAQEALELLRAQGRRRRPAISRCTTWRSISAWPSTTPPTTRSTSRSRLRWAPASSWSPTAVRLCHAASPQPGAGRHAAPAR